MLSVKKSTPPADDAGAFNHPGWRALAPPVGVLGAVVLSFVASNIYLDLQARQIDEAASSITDDDAPSVRYLAAARAALRDFEAGIESYVNQAVLGQPSDLLAVERARAALDSEITSYLKLPVHPGEPEAWENVAQNFRELNQVTNRVLDRVAAGDADGASALVDDELREVAARTSNAILSDIALNADHADQMATEIHETRRRLHQTTLALSVLTTVLAILSGLAATIVVGRHVALLRAHGQLLVRRAEELEQFSGRVAHDVLSPLGIVELATHVLDRRLAGDEAMQTTLARSRRALRQVRTIVDGLLAFARAGARPEHGARADVHTVVEDLAAELRLEAAAVDAEFCVDPFARCAVAASPGVLTSLIANLARNAIKYLGDAAVRRVVLRVRSTDNVVRVEVEDTGPGISPTLAGLVFEPHVRAPEARVPGLGLGLATVKRLAESHGGQVGLRSFVEKGTLVWFELPTTNTTDETPGPADLSNAETAVQPGSSRR